MPAAWPRVMVQDVPTVGRPYAYSVASIRQPEPEQPELLSQYKRLHLLGAGGFGVVYKVKHRTSGEIFALKEMDLRPRGGTDAQWSEQVEYSKEIVLMNKLQSFDHIISLID